MSAANGWAQRYWPARQRLVILTFTSAEQAAEFDRWANLVGHRTAVAVVAKNGKAGIEVLDEQVSAALVEANHPV